MHYDRLPTCRSELCVDTDWQGFEPPELQTPRNEGRPITTQIMVARADEREASRRCQRLMPLRMPCLEARGPLMARLGLESNIRFRRSEADRQMSTQRCRSWRYRRISTQLGRGPTSRANPEADIQQWGDPPWILRCSDEQQPAGECHPLPENRWLWIRSARPWQSGWSRREAIVSPNCSRPMTPSSIMSQALRLSRVHRYPSQQ